LSPILAKRLNTEYKLYGIMVYSPNNRFIPQALVTLIFSIPALIIYWQKFYFGSVMYLIFIVYIFANALSNLKYFANIEPLDLRPIKKFIAKRLNIGNGNKPFTMGNHIKEDVKGAVKFIDLLIDGSILAALFPSFRALATTIATNGSAAEIALSALIPLLLVVAFVYMVYNQVKKN
jgi:hypothetical protein